MAAKPTRRIRLAALTTVTTLLLAGCGVQIPVDPDGTTDRVREGTLRVGITHNPPWTDTASSAEPGGTEAELAKAFAAELAADIAWTEGSEAALVHGLEHGTLDLVIGGFVDSSPWQEHAAVTRAYRETQSEQGERERRVMLTPMGENRFLVTLESFLDRTQP